jgi:hypothetical protein
MLAQAAAETGDLRAVVDVLASDPKDRLAVARARLGRVFIGLVSFTGLHEVQRNISQLQLPRRSID